MELGNPTFTPAPQPGVRGVWGRRNPLEKALMVVCGVALVACVALVGTLAGVTSAPANDVSIVVKESPIQPGQLVPNAPAPEQPMAPEQRSSRLPVYHGRTGEEVCSSEQCVLAAAAIIEALDKSADPCQDFYQFACGGWIDKNPVPESSSRWGQFDILRRELSNALSTILTTTNDGSDPVPLAKAKTMYAACMNEGAREEEGVGPLLEVLSEFGGYPMASDDWSSEGWSWQDAVGTSRRYVGADYLISVWVFADQKDTDHTAIYIDQTSLGLPRSVLVSPDSYEERVTAYKTYVSDTAVLLNAGWGGNSATLEDVEPMFQFEMQLANITMPSEDRRDIDRMYNPMTVAELADLTPAVDLDWQALLTTMFEGSGVSVAADTRVIVQETNYLTQLATLLAVTPPRVVANYLAWRHVKALGGHLNQAMQDAAFRYTMVATGVSSPDPKWKECADTANDYLGIALGTKYVEQYFSQQAKDEASEMVEDIRAAFKDLLDVNTWMDADTKPRAVEKADAITKFIAYPDWYGNTSALEAFYAGLGPVTPTTHFTNVLSLSEWWSQDELSDFGQVTERSKWFSAPTIVNAFYMPEFNSITFPAGILQPPFYRANSLQALNYGGIGQVIGHEITHGFDDQGRQNDKDGNAIPWWTNATLDAFTGKAQCVVDQYSSIRVPDLDPFMPNATLNGVNTQGENIADNGGLREAFLAYQKYVDRNGVEPRLPGLEQYTPEQLFFLANANIWCGSITVEGLLNQVLTDPHSPGQFRVQVPMSNMDEFASVWSCPSGSNMNPVDKCVVW